MDASVELVSEVRPVHEPAAEIISRSSVWFRRGIFIVIALAVYATGSWSAVDILSANGFEIADIAILTLFLISFAFISITFSQSLLGFLVFALAKNPEHVATPISKAGDEDTVIATRTALLVPVYQEDPERVADRVRAIVRSLRTLVEPSAYEVFVLSDTQNEKLAAREEAIFTKLKQSLIGKAQLTYRRRVPNTGRKAGNIMDFCERWGPSFDFMLVLDADSVMSGKCIARLIRMIQSRPEAAIVQTVPRIIFAKTPFARCMQFGHRLCGEILTAGASYWQLGHGNYYGHNAIIRIAPFAKYCQLPIFAGRGTLSGHIMSHDFVEAAYLGRAGYEVWNVPTGDGSYEELPSNIIDYAKRDRRWCQGNLQHSRILIERGLHPINRFHLVQGIMAYVSSLLWFVVIVLALGKFSYEALVGPVYFERAYQLFPIWPEFKTAEAIQLFFATLSLLLAPKIFGLIFALTRPALRRGFGGTLRLALGLLLECIFSTLIAPVMMIFNTQFIISVLTGRLQFAWGSQDRDGRGIGAWEALICLKWQILLGVVMMAVVLTIIPDQFWWIAPIMFGLCASLPLTVLTSRESIGRFFVAAKLFAVPEETDPPLELQELSAE